MWYALCVCLGLLFGGMFGFVSAGINQSTSEASDHTFGMYMICTGIACVTLIICLVTL